MTEKTTPRSASQALPTHGTPDLFADTTDAKPSRRPSRAMMHVFDTDSSACCTDETEGSAARFRCAACGHESGWMPVRTTTEAKRGIPCPDCNHEKEATRAAWAAIRTAWQAGGLEFRSSRDGAWFRWTMDMPPNEKWPGWPPEWFRASATSVQGGAPCA